MRDDHVTGEMERYESTEFSALLKYADCGICAYKIKPGEKPVLLYMTDGFCQICDGTKEEISIAYKQNRFFGVAPEYHSAMQKMIEKVISSRSIQQLSYMAITLKGNQKWCSLSLNPDVRQNGEIVLYGTFHDLSIQMSAQQDLTKLINNVPGAVCLYRYTGKNLEPIVVSDSYSKILGTDAYQVLDEMNDMEFRHVHPDDLEEVKEKVIHSLFSFEKLNHTYRSLNEKTQEYRWINVQAKAVPQNDGSIYAFVLYTDITRDKEIEQELYTNQRLLESAATQAGVWYWNCKWRKNLSYPGKRFCEDFGLPDVIVGFGESMFSYGIVLEEYRIPFMDMCRRILDGEPSALVIVRGRLKDGSIHWMEFSISNVFDEQGEAQEAVGVLRLVDDVKEMERRYELEKHHATEDQNLIGYAHFDLGDVDALVEKGMNIVHSVLNEEMQDKLKQMHDRDYLLRLFDAGDTEHSFEYQRLMDNGKYIWVRSTYHLIKDPYTNEVIMFEYCYDINQEKTLNILTEFAVNDDYDLLGFVNMSDQKTIMVYGRNSYNPHDTDIIEEDYYTSLLRFTQNAVCIEDRDEYYKKASLSYVQDWMKTHDKLEFYFSTIDEDGHRKSKQVRYYKYKQDLNCYIYIQSDITKMVEEQKEAKQVLEKALQDAQVASKAKTSFLSQMSHEIRTPMNAIIGMNHLAQTTTNQQEIQHYLQEIDSSSQYLLGIINDILDMSRIESGKMELHPQWINGRKILSECVAMLRPAMDKKMISFIYPEVTDYSNLYYYVDSLRIQQIYMNLLNNAIKFTPCGGHIEFQIEQIIVDSNHCIQRIKISDTGCGMSQEFLQRVFLPFEMEKNPFSSTVQGTGLGLALVKSYVEKMGGRIWVESELGKGSTFTTEIPLETKVMENEENKTHQVAKVDLSRKRILLVDDHPLNREIAKKILEKQGILVEEAVDGQQAVDMYVASVSNFYDAILMDIRMPILNGLDATRIIRNLTREDASLVPIIAMTANAFDEDITLSMEAGMSAHLAKPIEPAVLYDTLKTWIC